MSCSNANRVRGELLHEWRLSQRLSVAALAGRSNLSVAQILQLEGGGDSCFYTPAIKESAARKVAYLLGGDPAVVIRPLDDSLSLGDSKINPNLIPMLQQTSVLGKRSLLFYQQPSLIAAVILMVIAVVLASGWLLQKWQQGGSQQFWRKRSGAVASFSLASSPEQAALETPGQALSDTAALAQDVDAEKMSQH